MEAAPWRRELIVAAALAEVGEVGYEAASMGRIARASGVSRTVLYDHFPSKLALFVELLRVEHAEMLSYMEAAFNSGGSTEARGARRSTRSSAGPRSGRSVPGCSIRPGRRLTRMPPVNMRGCGPSQTGVMASLLAADARRAGLEPDSARARAVFYMHRNALQAAVRWWRTHPDVSREELVDAAMAALWTGFGGMQPTE
jgi:AcrR family transcriptional regulator